MCSTTSARICASLEERFRVTLTVSADATVTGQTSYIIDRGEQVHTAEAARALAQARRRSRRRPSKRRPRRQKSRPKSRSKKPRPPERAAGEAPEQVEREGEHRRRRRRGRGRGRGGEPRDNGQPFAQETVAEHAVAHEDHDAGEPEQEGTHPAGGEARAPNEARLGGENGDGPRRRRRGRRGGRRNRRGRNGEPHGSEAPYSAGEGAPEPHPQHAVEDFDPAPRAEERPA